MTTVAIVGGGVAGLSLAYVLAKQIEPSSKILLFDSDDFAQACSLRSTAIVAKRGITSGHSALGDTLMAAFESFHSHVASEKPMGVFEISQFTSALTKLDNFKLRYPNGQDCAQAGFVKFKSNYYTSMEVAYLIDPQLYLSWLRSLLIEKVEFINTMVTEMTQAGPVILRTQDVGEWEADKVVFTGGGWNTLWNFTLPVNSKKIQGAYLEFSNVDFGGDSLSLTLEGDNFIYHSHSKKMLIGSTTDEFSHVLSDEKELQNIYSRLQSRLQLRLPSLKEGVVRIGLREKASQRKPYILKEGNVWAMGGYYKNGYSLALFQAHKLASQLFS